MKQSAGASAALMIPSFIPFNPLVKERKFRISLNPGAIGVKLSQFQVVEKAAALGFEAIVPLVGEIATMSNGQADLLQGKMSDFQLTWDAAGLPIDFRGDEPSFRTGLYRLHEVCNGLKNVGVTRMSTWIMPTHPTLTYRQNFAAHARRIRLMADVLADYDIRLGLEYVGPKTLMASQRFAFIRTMTEVQELILDIGKPNVGIQLDSFHWFCAGEREKDILQLNKKIIVTCDINDAIAGRSADQQLDGERALPGTTGVINLKGFLNALAEIGYDGPIRAEPFNADLNDMDNEGALNATYSSMKKSMELL